MQDLDHQQYYKGFRRGVCQGFLAYPLLGGAAGYHRIPSQGFTGLWFQGFRVLGF